MIELSEDTEASAPAHAPRAVSVLLVDRERDESNDTRRRIAAATAGAAEVVVCARVRDVAGWLERRRFDVVLFDATATPRKRTANVQRLRELAGHAPVVVLAESDDPDELLHFERAGAVIALAKGQVTERELGAALAGQILPAQRPGATATLVLSADRAALARTRTQILATALPDALAQGELTLVYQPLVDTSTGIVRDAEALLRWSHRECGLVSPGEVLEVADRLGLRGALAAWTIDAACAQLSAWDAAGAGVRRIAVNLTGDQLLSPDLAPHVQEVLERHELRPGRLTFELNEAIFRDPEAVLEAIHALRKMGVRFVIDDFATDLPSLRYLCAAKVDAIKIEREFLLSAMNDPGSQWAVAKIVEVAKRLGLETVGMGVERADQVEFLRSCGCELAQGYLYSRPLEAEAFAEWARTRRHEDLLAGGAGAALSAITAAAPAPAAPEPLSLRAGDTPELIIAAAAVRGLAEVRRRWHAPVARAWNAITVLVGVVVGLLVVLPYHDPPARMCPPAGEGKFQCLLTKGWAPAFTEFAVGLIATVILLRLLAGVPRRLSARLTAG